MKLAFKGDQSRRLVVSARPSILTLLTALGMLQACEPNARSMDPSQNQPQTGQVLLTPTNLPSTSMPDAMADVSGVDREVASSVHLCIGDGAILRRVVVRRVTRSALNEVTNTVEQVLVYDGSQPLWVIAYSASGVTNRGMFAPFGNLAAEMATNVAESTPSSTFELPQTVMVPDPVSVFGADGNGSTTGICAISAETGQVTSHEIFPPQISDKIYNKVKALPTQQYP